ncbi:MAG: hypothetical protein ABJC61_10135 [Acidobacteriota bacterium]
MARGSRVSRGGAETAGGRRQVEDGSRFAEDAGFGAMEEFLLLPALGQRGQ